MVVIADNGMTVKLFGSHSAAWGYAERLMSKRHQVWVVSKATAHKLGFI